MSENAVEFGPQGRLLFVGPLSEGREKLLESLEGLGLRSERADDFERAEKRLPDCDFVLYAASEKADLAPLKKIRETGKALGLILNPEKKSLVPLGLKAGVRAVFVDQVHPDEIVHFAKRLSDEGLLRREVRWLRQELRQEVRQSGPIGSSAATERLRRSLRQAGKRYQTVMLRGEKGSNFLQVARALHLHHPGLRHPILHWEGTRRQSGVLAKAFNRLENGKGDEGELLSLGGSLFIEDAQQLSPEYQKRLATVMSKKGISRWFRLIVGLTQDPEQLFQDEMMPHLCRENRGVLVRIPPLRERRKDIPELSRAILEELSRRVGRRMRTLTPAADEFLSSQKWWGNEAELEHTLWRAYLLTDGGTISVDDLQTPSSESRQVSDMEDFFRERLASVVSCLNDGQESDFYAHTIRSIEKPLFELVLRESGGNQMKAARLLGMNRNTLRRRVSELGLVRRVPARARSREK